MKDILKSIFSPATMFWILVMSLVVILWRRDYYKWRDERDIYKKAIKQADSIISIEQKIIYVAVLKDSTSSNKVDSIQILRNENDTINFRLSDIDSIRSLWPAN